MTKYGRPDLVTNRTYPSWGYMIENGGYHYLGVWNGNAAPAMNSHNHVMLLDDLLTWKIEIPVNTSANVTLPEGASLKVIRKRMELPHILLLQGNIFQLLTYNLDKYKVKIY